MEITQHQSGDVLDVEVTGRLDAYWADHLSAALEDAMRGGAHNIRLNMSRVSYMSSVGIRVLLKFYKQLQRINGTFAVSQPSEPVKTVLELAGLEILLAATGATAATHSPATSARRLDREGTAFEIFAIAPNAQLSCRVVGQPELLEGCGFTAQHGRTIAFPTSALGVGLGAFGDGFADCQGRFGEFLAAAGAAAYLPTDGTNVPDYLVSTGAFVPSVHVLYALICEGRLANLACFATTRHNGVGLADLVEASLDIAEADAVGIVMVAESAGLVGAALRRSPALGAKQPLFTHPHVREWVSFTPERAYPRGLALVVGVAARGAQPALSPLLRPLRGSAGAAGHFHAAAFSYRPLQKGAVELAPTVATLFEAETLQGVLHLLTDDRDRAGAGQSEFVRGACWIGPIASVTAEK